MANHTLLRRWPVFKAPLPGRFSAPLDRFSYHEPRDAEKKLSPHLVRDGAAFAELSASLHMLGYRYSGLLFNPSADISSEDEEIQTRHQPARFGSADDWAFLRESDLLILTSRPPLDDKRQGDRKQIARSYTWLECQVFRALDPFFGVCARSRIEVGDDFDSFFETGFENRFDVKFQQYPWARYKEFRRRSTLRYEPAPKSLFTTAGYLLCTKLEICGGEGSPTLIAAFGMGGAETLVWCNYLRRSEPQTKLLRSLLRSERGLVIGELSATAPPPEEEFFTMSFAENWAVQIVLNSAGRSV